MNGICGAYIGGVRVDPADGHHPAGDLGLKQAELIDHLALVSVANLSRDYERVYHKSIFFLELPARQDTASLQSLKSIGFRYCDKSVYHLPTAIHGF